MFLALARRAGGDLRHEEIQPDLADGDEARIIKGLLNSLAQRLQVALARALDIQRMDAQRIGAAGGAPCQVAHHAEVGAFDSRDHDDGNAGPQRMRGHLGPVGVEFCGV